MSDATNLPSHVALVQNALVVSSPTSITDVNSLIEGMGSQQALVQERLQTLDNQAALSEHLQERKSIDSLPAEIIARFFSVASYNDYLTALAISHVDGYWRTSALLTAEMWSSLDMGTHTQLALFDLFAARSRNFPLDIKMEIYDSEPLGIRLDDADASQGDDDARHDFVQTWIRAMVVHVRRWRKFHLELPCADDLRASAPQLSGLHAPLLQSFGFTIGSETADSLETIPSPWPILQSPALYALAMSKFRIDMSSIGAHLVDLQIDCDDRYLDSLKYCVNLRSLCLCLVGAALTPSKQITLISLRELQVAFIGQVPWHHIPHVMNHILAPSLAKLKLHLYFSQQPPPTSFIHLIKSATLFPKLESLVLDVAPGLDYYNSPPPSPAYIEHCSHIPTLLLRMPSITRLDVYNMAKVADLLSGIGATVLPLLRTLALHGCADLSGPALAIGLESSLKARKESANLSSIQSLEVVSCPSLPSEFEQVFGGLVPKLIFVPL